jgi:ribulose-5-phosphate 4-epimerase/fuculose-1-phosphate aldolase
MKRLLPILLAAAMFGAITNARASDTGGAADSAGALIDDLVVANHILYIQGVLDAFGHMSGRNPQNREHFFMSRALAPGLVTASDIMEFDLDGKPIDQSGRRMYVERYIHAEIYRARPEVMGVVHSHSPGVLPFGVSQTPLRAMVQTDWFLGDAVPVFDAMEAGGKFGFLINTPALGKALAQKLDGSTVLLLRAHGDAVVGRSVREAVSNAIYTELGAKLEMQALALGTPIKFLSPEEQRSQGAISLDTNATGGEERKWDMWKTEAMRSR